MDATPPGVTSRSTDAEREVGPSRAPNQAASDEPSLFIARLSAALAALRNGGKRERALAAIADDFDATQIREALAQLDKTRVSNRELIRTQLLARWRRRSNLRLRPPTRWLFKCRPAQERGRSSRQRLEPSETGRAQPRWVSTLPEGVMKKDAESTLIKVIAATDPQAALALMQPPACRHETRGGLAIRFSRDGRRSIAASRGSSVATRQLAAP